MNERVIRERLSFTKFDTFICVERAGEFIAVDDAENTTVELNIDADIKVLPCVILNSSWFGNKVTL